MQNAGSTTSIRDPKTWLLRELATTGRVTGDTTSIEDFGAIAAMRPNED